jgi:Reverse transcriptase (RNA-dependent DNA polymerase)
MVTHTNLWGYPYPYPYGYSVRKYRYGLTKKTQGSPVSCPICVPTLQILLPFMVQECATVHHCDVKNAYLNSHLQDSIVYSELLLKYKQFCELLTEFRHKPNLVCKWLVSVYRSKQGAHNWYAEVKKFFTDLGYLVSDADEAIFYKIDGIKYTIVAAATDNFTVIMDSINAANNLIQKQLPKCFKISDLGPINRLLGVSIT